MGLHGLSLHHLKMQKLTGSLNSGTDVECLGTGHLLRGWVGANGVGGIHFCAPKTGGLHKILRPFLRGHVFLCIPISFLQKRNNTEGINVSINVYYQNDGITNQHNLMYGIHFTLEKSTSCINHYNSVSLSSDSLFEELIEGKYF